MGEAFFCADQLESNSRSSRPNFKQSTITCELCRRQCPRTGRRQKVCAECRPAFIQWHRDRWKQKAGPERQRAYEAAYRRRRGIPERKPRDTTPPSIRLPLRKLRVILETADGHQ